jgi:hypothetical protein
MAKPKQKKSRGGPKTPAAPPPTASGKSGAKRPVDTENGRLIGLTLLAAVACLVFAFAPLSPLILTAPVVRPLLRRIRSGNHRDVTGAVWRWGLTVFLTILASDAFVRDRVLDAFPFASRASYAMGQAIVGAGGAPFGFAELFLGLVAFVLLAAASLGIAACVLLAVALGTAAAAGAVLFTHGNNILLISLVACPPWQWAVFAAAVLVFVPAVVAGGSRFYGITAQDKDRGWMKRNAVVAAGLFLLALLLRLALEGPYLALIRAWTVT